MRIRKELQVVEEHTLDSLSKDTHHVLVVGREKYNSSEWQLKLIGKGWTTVDYDIDNDVWTVSRLEHYNDEYR